MTEKKPTIHDLEIKLANSKVTKVRLDILNQIKKDYQYEILQKYDPLISKEESVVKNFKMPDQKNDIDKIIKAINGAIGSKYKLIHTTVCNIADGNTLTFIVKPNYDNISVVAMANKRADAQKVTKTALEARLIKWYRTQLFNISNGKDFDTFTM
jgi:hypothetical protein